jgi:hypothetical protein
VRPSDPLSRSGPGTGEPPGPVLRPRAAASMNASHSVTSITSITTSDTGTTSTQKARSFTSFTVAGHLHINACCDSADLDDVVTALVLAAAGLPASVLEPVGWVRSRSAPVALLANTRALLRPRRDLLSCSREHAATSMAS